MPSRKKQSEINRYLLISHRKCNYKKMLESESKIRNEIIEEIKKLIKVKKT